MLPTLSHLVLAFSSRADYVAARVDIEVLAFLRIDVRGSKQ